MWFIIVIMFIQFCYWLYFVII